MQVKSIYKTYEVEFKDEFESSVRDVLKNLECDSNYVIFIDAIVANMHPTLVDNRTKIIPSSERIKSYAYAEQTIEMLVEQFNVNKGTTIIAIGGGAIQDLTSFISMILFRGIDWVFIPTTLLTQCDSCIGSKIAINFGPYKNMLGGFNPPNKIVCTSEILQSLPDNEIKSGIGEMLHYFLINDMLDLSYNMVNDEYIRTNISTYIQNSLQIKKKMVEIDEFDKGPRNVFNYGHTFGHAIESLTNYEVNHGQAVTIGMDIANFISLHESYITQNKFNDIHDILVKNMPEYKITEDQITDYVNFLKKDKKNNKTGMIACILLKETQAEKVYLSVDKVTDYIRLYIKEYA